MPQAYGRCARLSCSVPPIALSWGSTALWLVSVPRIREDCTMSRQLLGYLVTRTLLTVSLPPLAQLPAQMPRRGFLRRGASSRNLSLLDAYWAERRALGYGACGDLRQRLLSPSAWTATLLAHQRSILACAARVPPGGSAKAGPTVATGPRVSRARSTVGAGPPAIFVPPAVSPGGPPRTTDTRPGLDAGTVVTSRARGGLVRPLGMAVKTCRALDPYA